MLVKVNAFAEDPYDAVGSFGIQLAVLCAVVSFLRIIRLYSNGITPNNLSLILRRNTVLLLSNSVTLIANMTPLQKRPDGFHPICTLLKKQGF